MDMTAHIWYIDGDRIFAVAFEGDQVTFAVEVDQVDPMMLAEQIGYAIDSFDNEQAALCEELTEALAEGWAITFGGPHVTLDVGVGGVEMTVTERS